MASFAFPFYISRRWKVTRKAYIQSVDGLCERCRANGFIVAGTQVHHKVKLTPENIDDPNISLSFDNLELLCDKCHHEEHDRYARCHKHGRYTVLQDGSVIM